MNPMDPRLRASAIATIWRDAQDLNFGEICQVADAALLAADNKILEIRAAKMRDAGLPQQRARFKIEVRRGKRWEMITKHAVHGDGTFNEQARAQAMAEKLGLKNFRIVPIK